MKKNDSKPVSAKGYYEFSEEYPPLLDDNGLRNRTEEKKKLTSGGKFAVAAVCLAAFIAAFVITSASSKISREEPTTQIYCEEGTTAAC